MGTVRQSVRERNERIAEALRKGGHPNVVAKAEGVSYCTVYRIKSGLKLPRAKHRAPVKSLTIIAAIQSGQTPEQAADALGVTVRRVTDVIERAKGQGVVLEVGREEAGNGKEQRRTGKEGRDQARRRPKGRRR